MTYQRKVEVEADYSSRISSYDGKTTTLIPIQVINKDVSEGWFMHIKPTGGNSNWSVTYRLDGVISGKYDIDVKVLPKSINGGENKRPCRFTATINYYDEDGKEQHYVCNDGSPINTNPDEIDVIRVATFKFPTCNYGEGTIGQPSITLTCNIRPNENARYDRNFYLDTIVLKRAKEE